MAKKIIFNGKNKAIVGIEHLGKSTLSPNVKKIITDIAEKHGAWYEGDGKDKDALDIPYKGSWDKEFAKTVKGYPEEFLYALFTNVDVNKQDNHFIDNNCSIFDSIIKHQKGAKYFEDRKFNHDQLYKFLKDGSEKNIDLIKMASEPATLENLKKFFKTGEKLMWPNRDWIKYPNKLGKMAKKAEAARNEFIKNAKSGVYVVGSGHIDEIRKSRANGGKVENKMKYPLSLTESGKHPLDLVEKGKHQKGDKPDEGRVKKMSPKKFLKEARPMKMTKEAQKSIKNFKHDMENGLSLGPLRLYKDGTEDGRHRATAAEELGIDKVPVIDFRTAKALGGALGSSDPNRFMQDLLKFSFQVLPLLRPGYLKEVPKQGFAHGGHVLEDEYPSEYMPGVGRQVMADGGEVEGDVSFAPPELEQALKTAREASQVNEPTLKAYEPTIGERIFGAVAGLGSEKPSPERRRFAEGVSEIAGLVPGLGNVMAAQEAKRAGERGDYGEMALASLGALPMVGGAEKKAAEKAVQIAKERVLNPQGLYSHASEAAANLPQAKGSYEQMMAMLQKAGVKPEEMRWSGVEQLAGQPVTREQLAQHFEQNLPKIEETVLQEPSEKALDAADAALREAINRHNLRHSPENFVPRYGVVNPEYGYSAPFMKTEEEARAHIERLPSHLRESAEVVPSRPEQQLDMYNTMRRLHAGEYPYGLPESVVPYASDLIDARNAIQETADEFSPKFGQYTIPGGKNYREVLLHMPERIDVEGSKKVEDFVRSMQEKYGERWLSKVTLAEEKKYDDLIESQGKAEKGLEYRSSHWDQPNVLGHLRMSDRTGPEGEKILHLEELQSDWGQQGRERGFAQKVTPEMQEKVNEIASKLDPRFVPAHAKTSDGRGIDTDNFLLRDINHWKETGAITPEDAVVLTNYANIKSGVGLIPSAPYVEKTQHWVDLGLKRALKEAAEGGYHKMVWTPGAEQAARYDLSKHIDELHWHRGNLVAYDKDGNKVIQRTGMSASELPDVVGKDVADKLLAQEASSDGWRSLEGQDLSVGGEGMKGFYDKIVPTRLKELVKKLDPEARIELGAHDLPRGHGDEEVKGHVIHITPKMREAILKGLPAYERGGSVDDIIDRHCYADGGSVDDIEAAIRAAQDVASQKGMEHERGFSGAVEFSPVSIREPLSGYSAEVGRLPKETASIVQPALQAASEVAPYFTPAATIAAARDIALGLKEGSPTDVALSALGLPGKAAKAAAIGASALMPDEAQADTRSAIIKAASRALKEKPAMVPLEHAMSRVVSPFSEDPDIVKRALDLANKLRIEQEVTGPKSAFYNVAQSRPVKDVTATVGDIPGLSLKQEKPMSWEDVYNIGKGGTLINLGGDRSNFGRLTHINDEELAWPVDLHAGSKYMLEPSPGAIWANAPGPATGFKKSVLRAAEKGDVYGVFSPMGPQSVDSSHNMFDALMAQVPNRKITKAAAKEFDAALKSGKHGANEKERAKLVEAMKDWPGIANPKAASEFARNLPGGHRRAIVQFMDAKGWRDKGFPMVGETRAAITDPSLKGLPQGMMGHRVVKFDPSKITPETSFEHSTYPVATGGEYVGDVPPVLRHYAMPDVLESIVRQPARDLSIIHPFSVDPLGRSAARKFFEEQPLQQEINQRFIDSVMKGLERREKYGIKKGGAVKKSKSRV